MTLEEVWCGYKSSISHLHVFYCVAFVNVPKEARTKLDSKGVKCIFIGYCKKTRRLNAFFDSWKGVHIV
jgi:hypothetical protein